MSERTRHNGAVVCDNCVADRGAWDDEVCFVCGGDAPRPAAVSAPAGEATEAPRCARCGKIWGDHYDGDFCDKQHTLVWREPAIPPAARPGGEGRTQFDYLLNALEAASQHDAPATQGYAEKRRALFAYVRDLEARSPAPASGAPTSNRLSHLIERHCPQGVAFDCTDDGEIRCTIGTRDDGDAFGLGFGDSAENAIGAAEISRNAKANPAQPPASGAPGEEVTRYRMFHEGMTAFMDDDPEGGYVEYADYASLRTRLAAAERAGVALREALGAWDAEAGVLAFTNVLIAARKCAALTPTAPSPEERADG